MNEIKNELNKIYKLTGIRLSVENEAEIDIVNLKKYLPPTRKNTPAPIFYKIFLPATRGKRLPVSPLASSLIPRCVCTLYMCLQRLTKTLQR